MAGYGLRTPRVVVAPRHGVAQRQWFRVRSSDGFLLDAAAVVGYVVVFGAFLLPVVLGGRLLALTDGPVEAFPVFASPLALWTPSLWGGFPSAADPIAQSWYPLTLLAHVPYGWNLFVGIAYVLIATFTYGYVSAVTGSRLAGFVSGLVYALSGAVHGLVHLGHLTILHTLAWIPLALWALERLRYRSSVLWLVVGPLAVASACLAGHPQVFLYSMTVLVAYVAVSAAVDERERWLFLRRAGWTLVLGMGLAAVQLLPSLELASLSLRPTLTFAGANLHALRPSWSVAALFFHPGPDNLLRLSAYVGWAVLFLAGVGLVARRSNWRTAFWASVAVIGFLLSLGEATPIAVLAYRVPLYGMFRAPNRHLFELTFALSVMAGTGIAAFHRRVVTPRRLVRAAVGFLAVLGAGALVLTVLARAGFPPIITQGFMASGWPSLASPGVALPLVALLWLLGLLALWTTRPGAWWPPAGVVLVLLVDLAGTGWMVERDLPWPTPADFEPPAHAERYRRLLDDLHQRILPVSSAKGDRDELPPNLSRLWGVPSASGYGPLVPARLGHLLPMTPYGHEQRTWGDLSNQSLDIMAVRYVFLPTQRADPLFSGARWKPIEQIGDTLVFENLRAMPRVWLVPSVRVAQPDEVRSAIRTSALPDGQPFDPRRMALVEAPVDLATDATQAGGDARVVKLSDTAIRVHTRSTAPAFLVVSDAYYPGWRATVDDASVPLVRANYVLRGLVVPAGEHAVRLDFRPTSVYVGAAVSLLALLALAALTLVRPGFLRLLRRSPR